MKRRTFSQEFKLDAANLILKQGYSYREAENAAGVSQAVKGTGSQLLTK